MTTTNYKIAFLIAGNVITGAIQSILMPIIVTYYESLYFVMLISSLIFLIVFNIVFLIMTNCKPFCPNKLKILVFSGIFNALSAILLIYCANPDRTPIVIQAILAGTIILPSVGFTRYILRKKIQYDKRYIVPSVIFLLVSVGISLIPLYSTWTPMAGVWILIFFTGVVFRSAFSILQEKYIIDTKDYTLLNKIVIVCFSRWSQLVVVISFYWLEFVIGNTHNPNSAFENSVTSFFTDDEAFWLVFGFIVAYLLSYVFAVYLNSISTNYNMILSIIINPITISFFKIFSQFNRGENYPVYVIFLCIGTGTISVLLWIKGEDKTKYTLIDEELNQPFKEESGYVTVGKEIDNSVKKININTDPTPIDTVNLPPTDATKTQNNSEYVEIK